VTDASSRIPRPASGRRQTGRPLAGLAHLTWLEIKIFLREPLGLIGSLGAPILLFVVLGRVFRRAGVGPTPYGREILGTGVPVFAAVLIAIGAVLSLITIIATYREGGILKRLRATPLRPHTILTAHVAVKLLLTTAALAFMIAAGRSVYPVPLDGRTFDFALALLISTLSLLSIGFLVASVVPTARFAQPVGSLIFYPMLMVSGLVVPVHMLPPALQTVSAFVPLTYAVSLMRGVWTGSAWSSHVTDVAVLAGVCTVCTALSARVFRWE
jgi:ABC-2 type transport system permease protein